MKLWNDEDTVVVTEAGKLLHEANETLTRVRAVLANLKRDTLCRDWYEALRDALDGEQE
jgi:P2-related tail formation protein